MKTYLHLLPALGLLVSCSIQAQQPPSTNYYSNIKNYDLSKLWTGDKLINGPEKITFPEPLGFIGDNFQRFYIHYTSITKSKDNPYVYHVTGKTRVKNNICHFTGQIQVIKALLYKEPEWPEFGNYKSGKITSVVTLYEDSTQNGSGVIKGTLISNFYLDKGSLLYNTITFGMDGFSNNECTGTWTSYKTGKSKKCNWGDYQIPESDKLDNGTSEFMAADEYLNNGWENYKNAWTGADIPVPVRAKARAEEARKWWQ